MTWDLPTVERTSTFEQVHRLLREAIIEGTIPPGEHLREIALAKTLATSRSTVREAIRHLVQEGLVDYVLHRGNFVRALSLHDRLDVCWNGTATSISPRSKERWTTCAAQRAATPGPRRK
jgi:DNA-binding GntR family transcriptional regulator